jgi:cobalt-zinc-cadmium efflux system membrane fusion protein
LNNLLPTAESSSQTVMSHVWLVDNADNQWRAGMTVRGDVVLSEKEVPLAVKTSAIQRQEGTTVVYVQKGDTFEMRKVELGEADREWTEILSGLNAGESYVATNSFIIKADIGKSAAEHED